MATPAHRLLGLSPSLRLRFILESVSRDAGTSSGGPVRKLRTMETKKLRTMETKKLRTIETYEKQKIVTKYACYSSEAMSTSKIIKETKENLLQFDLDKP